jgi:hypothetical protein
MTHRVHHIVRELGCTLDQAIAIYLMDLTKEITLKTLQVAETQLKTAELQLKKAELEAPEAT